MGDELTHQEYIREPEGANVFISWVTRGSGRYLAKCEAIRTETLRQSRHFCYPDGDLELLRGYFTELIGQKEQISRS